MNRNLLFTIMEYAEQYVENGQRRASNCWIHGTFWLWSTLTPILVSMFTHYNNMKRNVKCRNWGGLGVKGNPRYM